MSRRGLPGNVVAYRMIAPAPQGDHSRSHRRPGRTRRAAEAGMTTAEYAVGTLAACAFAALLIAIIRSPEIRATLAGLITSALGLGA